MALHSYKKKTSIFVYYYWVFQGNLSLVDGYDFILKTLEMCTRVAGGFFYHWATWEAPRRGYYVHLLWLLLKWQFHKSRELLCLVYCRISPGPGIYIELDPYYSVKGHRRVEGRTQQRGKPKVRTGRALDLRGIPTSSFFFFFLLIFSC